MAKSSKAHSNKPRNDLPIDYVRSLFRYDRKTGVLFWRRRIDVGKWWNSRYANTPVGTLDKDGYLAAHIHRVRYTVHRLIWVIVKGKWPTNDIDHKREPRTNNRIGNLREATRTQNLYNSKKRSDNTSGYKGVYWNRCAKKWQAHIKVGNDLVYLGIFTSLEEAAAVREAAAKKVHRGFFRLE